MIANLFVLVLTCLTWKSFVPQSDDKRPSYPSFTYQAARAHEIKPHRHTIPLEGVDQGHNQLRLTLTVSPAGDVVDAEASGNDEIFKFWPQLQSEVRQWKFTPFEKNGKAITAQVEDYLDLVQPERPPQNHVTAPLLGPKSKVTITLERTVCFGTCPSYTLTLSTDGVVFDGRGFVVAPGKHTDRVDAGELRNLAEKFVAADFYSMDSIYRAGITDSPTYVLSIAIDGQTKQVEDYVGSRVGMPAVITELEDDVDAFGRTQRWIKGSDGLVQALQAEKFNFRTFAAQAMLKEAATRGQSATVQELLEAGVPLTPMPAPKAKAPFMTNRSAAVGWLNAASSHPEALEVLIGAGASRNDQSDKDAALAGAARSGNLEAARALIAYGANPNVDLSELTTKSSGGMTMQGQGAGSVLIYAAESGNPDMVRELLRYHPVLEMADGQGRTAMFAAGKYRHRDEQDARVECVRLLAQAGANVNARDTHGNTPLHETFLIEVEEELLKLGAEVNVRNNEGETPIFTTGDRNAISLLIEHGADVTIRNNKGETVMEAAKKKGPQWEEALREAILKLNPH